MEDDSKTSLTVSGTVRIQIYAETILEVRNVYDIPHQNMNLFSSTRLDLKGIAAQYGGGRNKILDRDRKIISWYMPI